MGECGDESECGEGGVWGWGGGEGGSGRECGQGAGAGGVINVGEEGGGICAGKGVVEISQS